MAIGNPVTFVEGSKGRLFSPLIAKSQWKEDTGAFDEELLQTIVRDCPSVLPVKEFLPSSNTLVSLGTEIYVDLGGYPGRIDNLLVTGDGYVVIVETKLYRNRESVREVVTQALQYGMAISRMSLAELEERIRRKNPSLEPDDSLRECVVKLAGKNGEDSISEDFEEAMERHLRFGEILLLVVSDGVHVSVERVTQWLQENGKGSPFKLGLVELKLYENGAQTIVMPRAVLKTTEISRHTVVVDIQASAGVSTAATVVSGFQGAGGGRTYQTRSIRPQSIPLSSADLIQQLPEADREPASELIDKLSAYGFDQGNTTSAWLQFGLTYPSEGGEFHPLVYLGKKGVAAYPLGKIRNVLGDDAMIAFHQELNQFGQFFGPDQIEEPSSQGAVVPYAQVRSVIPAFVEYLDAFKSQILSALQSDDPM